MHNNMNVNVSGPVQPTSTYKTKVLKGNHSFAYQVTEPNMKYVIKHDFVLDDDVTIPANCVLQFDGGSINNGAENDFIIDLNHCKIQGTASGLKLKVTNPYCDTVKFSDFGILGDSDTSYNTIMLQYFAQAFYRIIVDVESATFNNEIITDRICIEGFKTHQYYRGAPTLNFPNSRGIVFSSQGQQTADYNAECYIVGLSIISNGHCVDFFDSAVNSNVVLFQSRFCDLHCESSNGDCFHNSTTNYSDADNYKYGKTFNLIIERCHVRAINGYGFVGMNGNNGRFVNIYDNGCGLGCYFNCQGVFINHIHDQFGNAPKPACFVITNERSWQPTITCIGCHFEEYNCFMKDIMQSVYPYVTLHFTGISCYFNTNDVSITLPHFNIPNIQLGKLFLSGCSMNTITAYECSSYFAYNFDRIVNITHVRYSNQVSQFIGVGPIPSGNTADRPTDTISYSNQTFSKKLFFDKEINKLIVYNNSGWIDCMGNNV